MVETKVKAATSAAAATTFVLWLLSTYAWGGTDVPEAVQGVIALVVPGLLTLAAGYAARHTRRPDLGDAAPLD